MDVIVGSRQVGLIFDNVPHMGIAHNVVAILCRYPMQIVFPASHRMQKVGVCQVKIARQDVLHGLALLWCKGCNVQLLESEDQAILLESHTCFRRFARDVMMRLGRTTDRMAIGQEDWLLVHKSSQAHPAELHPEHDNGNDVNNFTHVVGKSLLSWPSLLCHWHVGPGLMEW